MKRYVDKDELEAFVWRYYRKKDLMHNLTHIERILETARVISRRHKGADSSILTIACYFHGIDVKGNEMKLSKFLRDRGFHSEEISRIFQAAVDSQTASIPKTLEGKILHDAHLLEGGRNFHVVKCLVTGLSRGSSLLEITKYYQSNIYGKYKCYLAENKALYREKEEYASQFFNDLRKNLSLK